MIPVPGHPITTVYGARSSWWSCNRDADGNGMHTGADFAANEGTTVVAARSGTVRFVNFGSSFGSHQVAVVADDDDGRDFYAHMCRRNVSDGQHVEAGASLGAVGQEGNASGPHLHFERHTTASGGWSCAIVTNPQPSLDSGGGATPEPTPKPSGDDMATPRIFTSKGANDASSSDDWPSLLTVEGRFVDLSSQKDIDTAKRYIQFVTNPKDGALYTSQVRDMQALLAKAK